MELVSNGTILAQDIKACDEKVDIWALGVTLFELLTGRLILACIMSVRKAVGARWCLPQSLDGLAKQRAAVNTSHILCVTV